MERVFVQTVDIDGICEIIVHEGLTRKNLLCSGMTPSSSFQICEKKVIDQLQLDCMG